VAQQKPELKWGMEEKGDNIPYELKKTSEGVVFQVYRDKFYLKINHINKIGSVANSATYNMERYYAKLNAVPVSHFYVDGFYYYISRAANKEIKGMNYYLYKINCNSLKMEADGELFLEQNIGRGSRVSKLHISVSPNKELFAIGFHLRSGNPAEKIEEDSVRYKYSCSVYDNTGNELSKFEYSFSKPKEFFNWYKNGFVLNNDGNLLCTSRNVKGVKVSTNLFTVSSGDYSDTTSSEEEYTPTINAGPFAEYSIKYEEKEYLFLPLNSDILYSVPILSFLKEKDTTINEISILQPINSEQRSNVFCIVYGDSKNNTSVCTGFAIVEFSSDGKMTVQSVNPAPKHQIEKIRKVKSEENYYPLWRYVNGKYTLKDWVFKDFLQVGKKYFVISEYNYNHLKLHTSPPDIVSLGPDGLFGDAIIYRLNEDFKLETSILIPKFYDSECVDGSCKGLLGQAALRGYSVVPEVRGISIFYWNNTKNEILFDSLYTGKRWMYPTKRNSKYLALYRTSIPNSGLPKNQIIVSGRGAKYQISANTTLLHNDKVLFYGSKAGRFKIAELPIE
tara:strand:- start:14315 stop:16000 length:1686 start_codon:yes stop_codon:yes gene_type:complete